MLNRDSTANRRQIIGGVAVEIGRKITGSKAANKVMATINPVISGITVFSKVISFIGQY